MKYQKKRKIMNEYGFYDRLTESFPSQLIIDITEKCNLKCIHCPHPTFKESSNYAGRLLSVDLNKKAVDEIAQQGKDRCAYIRYTSNGEPLLHPNAHEMIQYAVENSKTFVTLTTNGTILNEKKMELLLASGLHMIDISIDAYTPETYKKVRGGRLEQVKRNIIRLINKRNSESFKTKIVVSYIKQPLNIEETNGFVKFWKEQGVDDVVVRNLHTAAGAMSNKGNTAEPRRPCLYPWERMTLDAKGMLAFCPTDWAYSSVFADFQSTTIKKAWQSDFMINLRKAHLKNSFSHHKFCGQCPDWKLTSWPNKGRSYANLVEDLKVIM